MQADKPNTQTMWGCMLAGDLAIRKLKDKAIVIVGDTRVGKSTLLNYLMKIPMQGYKKSKFGDVNLQPIFQKGVQTKLAYQSCTLVPNIGSTTLHQQKIQMCDTAGFDDQGRPYYGVFGVSYMLEKIFQTVKQIKFILVVSHAAFENQKLSDMIKPFLNFVKILKPELLIRDAEFAQKFMKSVAIVAIKTREDINYYLGKMYNVHEALQREKDLPNERKIIKMLFNQIIENQRLQVFKRGEDKKQIETSNILESLNEKNWKYYNFQQNYSSSIIFQLPFAKQYENMKDAEKERYKKDLAKKKKIIQHSYQVLQQLAHKGKQNWHSKQPIDYDQEFIQIRKIIQDHPYGQLGLMLHELGVELLIPEGQQNVCIRLDLLQKFIQIQKSASQINAQQEYSQVYDKITAMIEPCKQIFEICRRTFCRTRQQEESFITFMFINIRSLYESLMQRKIHKSECAWVPFIVKDGVTKIIEGGAEDLTAQFFQGFVPTISQRQRYTKIIDDTVKDINKVIDPKQARHLLYVQVNNNLKGADNQIKAKKYKLGLQQALKANKMFQTFVEVLDEYEKHDAQIRKFKQIQILKKIAGCLECMNLSRLAAEIYEHMGSVHLLIKCYERLMNSKKKLNKKYEIMEDFAKILIKYGKRQKLIELYQQMIDEFQCYPSRQDQIKQKLSSLLLKDLVEQTKQYAENLSKANTVVQNDAQIIQKIEMELNYYVEGEEEREQSSDEELDEAFEKRNQGVEQQQQQIYYDD